MRVLLTILVAFVSVGPLQAHQPGDGLTLVFALTDSLTHEPLPQVVCRVFTSNDKAAAFAVSDADGKLTVVAPRDSRLSFTAMGYAGLRRPASSFSVGKVNLLSMAQQSVTLREVKVKAPPIRSAGDTLSYNVGQFVGRGDAHLEDVLRKLPGITVQDNGTVSYQGKAINKFYIEGKDLLGNNYNQATRNLPVDAVSTVEVLENHQPVKMLRGKQVSDKAALNIRLDKKKQGLPFGEMEAKGGWGDNGLWQGRLFLTKILKSTQWLLTAKGNNVGQDVTEETMEHIDMSDLDAFEPLPASWMPTPPYNEDLPAERYNDNRSQAGGLNALTSLTKNATLRVNVLANHRSEGYSNSTTNLYGGQRTVQVEEANRWRMHAWELTPRVHYELNGDKAYVSDELRYDLQRQRSDNNLSGNSMGVSQHANIKPAYVRNYLNAGLAVGRQTLTVKWMLQAYNRHDGLLTAADSMLLYNVDAHYASRVFLSRAQVGSVFSLWGNPLELTAKMTLRRSRSEADDIVTRQSTIWTLTPTYTIRLGSEDYLELGLPVQHLASYINAATKNSRGLWRITPSAALRRHLGQFFTLRLGFNTAVEDAASAFYSLLPVHTNYRSVRQVLPKVFISRSYNVSGGLSYRNLTSLVFANVNVGYRRQRDERYLNFNYTDTLTTITECEGTTTSHSLTASSELSKSFATAGITLKWNATYVQRKAPVAQNELLVTNRSHVLGTNIDVDYHKLKWLRLYLQSRATLFWERTPVYRSSVLSQFANDASLYLFPTAKWDIRMHVQGTSNEVESSVYKHCYLMDAEVHWKMNKTIEWNCTLRNLMNATSYSVTQVAGLNTTTRLLPLRGRECLVGVLVHI